MGWICSLEKGENRIFEHSEFFDKRFTDDKCIYESNDKLIILDGILLNKKELYDKYNSLNLSEFIEISGFTNNGCSQLRGPFCGYIYDKSSNSIYAFGNQTGDSCVFWYSDPSMFAASSDFNVLFSFCRSLKKKITFNQTAANHILSLGFVTEGNTFAEQIRKTNPGEAVVFNCDTVTTERYHTFDNSAVRDNLSLDDATRLVDEQFRAAVSRCFEKDNEYSYYHLADMSAGLDSRMVNTVAKKLGYKNITNISYSQTGSNEYKYSQNASYKLKNEFLYKPLDDITFLYFPEKIVRMNYGLSVYYGITGGESMLSSINFDKFGLEHTGMIGDAVVGTFCKTPEDSIIDPKRICYTDLIDPQLSHTSEYPNHELFSMYYRAFQGAITTHYIRRNYTEAVSPFMDVDFLQTCLEIPLKYRCNDKLYWHWIDTIYPELSTMPTSRERNKKISLSKERIYHMMGRNFRRVVIKVCKSIGLWRIVTPKNSMNPFDKWYAQNSELRDFIDSYYSKNLDALKQYTQIYENIQKIFSGVKTTDKLTAVSLLAIYNVYFSEKI